MRPWFGGLWRHADFRRLWLGQTISAIGSGVSRLAIPLTASLALSAGIARVSGPGLAGLLVQLLTAPMAVAVDAASFLVSAAGRQPGTINPRGQEGRCLKLRLGPSCSSISGCRSGSAPQAVRGQVICRPGTRCTRSGSCVGQVMLDTLAACTGQ